MTTPDLKVFIAFGSFLLCVLLSCKKDKDVVVEPEPDDGMVTTFDRPCLGTLTLDYQQQTGCDGQIYENPAISPYRIPMIDGTTFQVGLANCSSSFHSPGQPDEYAFDFNADVGVKFTAARGGVITIVDEDEDSSGGGAGNYVVIDHLDETFGLYYHSPKDGIHVEVGDTVVQGQILGDIGRSGLAGYPHLHFIVVRDEATYPYQSIPVTFSNAFPPDVVLKSNTTYTACED